MNTGRTLGGLAKIIIYLFAFFIVILYNAYISPAITGNARFWFRTGDYASLIIVFAETYILGTIFRYLLIWAFKANFERRQG